MCMVNECMRNMAGDQNALGTQISPIVRQVREIDILILRFLLGVGLNTEAIHPTRFAREKALVIYPFMFIGNPTVDGQKWRKERRVFRRRLGHVRDREKRGRDHRWHFG